MDYFITPNSLNFFRRFSINTEFLKIDPSLWLENEEYQNGSKLVKKHNVINDRGEA